MVVFPCACGFPSAPKLTMVIESIVMIVSLVIMFLTSHFRVRDEFPNRTTSMPISTISPCLAELLKLISDICLVTILEFSSWMIAYNANSSSIHASNFPPNNVPLGFKSSG